MQAQLDIVTRPPLRYYGGKFRIAPWIISLMPAHSNYVEVFGGGAGVLLRKPRARVEIYNDLDHQVVSFFQILRDPASIARLIQLVALTPFSRAEFDLSYEPSANPIEAARRFCFRCQAGHGNCSMDPLDSNGFRSCDIRSGKSYAREWTGIPAAIAAAGARFQGVTIENLDFRKLIPKFDSPETFFFCDPPYPMSTRSSGGKGYVHEMPDEAHRQLAWILRGSKAKILITTYPCDLYDGLYRDWYRQEKKTMANGQVGAVKRTEVAFMNYAPPDH